MQRIYRVAPDAHPHPLAIRDAATVLQAGGLALVPTETVYGVGVSVAAYAGSQDMPDETTGYARIFSLKQRDVRQTVPWLVAGVDALDRFGVDVPPQTYRLAQAFWPGALTLIVGATEHDIAPVRAVLETFSSKIFCFGGPGKGQAAKLANQVSLAASMVGMADALSFAQQSDLDLTLVREMILGGTGKSGAMEQLAPKSLDGDWKPGFMVKHFLKDLGLALQVAEGGYLHD